jgi:hypothetical protein
MEGVYVMLKTDGTDRWYIARAIGIERRDDWSLGGARRTGSPSAFAACYVVVEYTCGVVCQP